MTITELYERRRTGLFLFACRIIKEEEAAKDIVQNAFVYMIEHESETPEKMVFELVKNRCLNYLRDMKFRRDADVPETNGDIIEVDTTHTEILYHFLERLTKSDKDFIDLYLKGLSPQQMADELGVSNKRVRNRKNLILNILKKMRLSNRQ